jgi:hypothetical protein
LIEKQHSRPLLLVAQGRSALAMAAERAEQPASALKFHGWL